uniref:Paraoxonase n=1 Tax=Lepisosteus oculatus TaxID=7918 RepID=W5MYF0_LEPOC
MGKILIVTAIAGVLLAFLGERYMTFRTKLMASRDIISNHLPNCVYIKGLGKEYGSEDLTILPGGLALISTGLKYPNLRRLSDDPGKIYALNLEEGNLKPVELKISRGFDLDSFFPHGISTFIDEKDQTVYLFVVNHPDFKSTVEIFRFVEEDSSLTHLKTIEHELLHSVNDIVAVGPESFYATNDHYFTNALFSVEYMIGLALCNVVYYSPEEVREAAAGFYSANGINISPDKKHLYVGDVFDHVVHVLEIQENKTLVPLKKVDVGTLPDNIEVDSVTGDLWLGCHPNAWRLLRYDPENPPGSEVIQIQNIHSEKPTVTKVYVDDGHVIEGSSVATPYKGKLFIGTMYQKAIICDLNPVDL